MVFQKPLRTIFGKLIHLTFKAMVAQATLDVLLQTQDGGNSSDTEALPLSMKEARYWKFKAMLIKKIEILELTPKEMDFINNGILSMLMNGRVNLAKVNLIKSLVFTLKDHSMLSQSSIHIEILILSTIET
jgi:hypothetical protein